MTHDYHPLLSRQLRRVAAVPASEVPGGSAPNAGVLDAAAIDSLLQLVSESYAQFDRDLALHGRSLVLSSEELTLANDRLRAEAATQQQVLQTLRGSARALLPDLPPSQATNPMADLQALALQLDAVLQQRLHAERLLGDSERQFRTLVANLPGCVYRRLNDAAPTLLFVSDAIADAFGWPATDFTSGRRAIARQVHPDDRARVMAEVTAAVQARTSYNLQYRYRHADGSQRWANERGQGVYDAAGALLYLDGVLFDRTDSIVAQQELGRTRQQLIDAIGALDVGILMLDENDRVLLCNAKCLQYYASISSHMQVGTHVLDIYRAVYRSGQFGIERDLSEAQWLEQRMVTHRALDNGPTTTNMEVDGRWLQYDNSRTSQGITIRVITDITAIKQMLVNLSHARDVAEAASRAKTRFLANMSHELRTPLNAVIGAAQLMKTGEHDAEQRAHLVGAIERSGTNLLGLIENILDLARIEAGELRLAHEDFHLVECVEAALATAGLQARSKGLQLACIIDPQLPFWRFGDPLRLRQVLLNLLGNAVKFTERGEIVLRIEPGALPTDVCISVTDTGVGIPASALPCIFEPFQQADDGSDRRYGGSGLGLAIVRQLVDAMGGRIEVRSTVGAGACFQLALPLPLAHKPMDEPAANGLRVAFFEPHDASAEALHKLLLRMGSEPRRCTTAGELRDWHLQDANSEGRSWVLVCTDVAQTLELLEQVADHLEPERLIGMSSVEYYEAELARQRVQLPRNVIKPVSRAALASRFVAQAAEEVPGAASHGAARAADPHATHHVLIVEDDALNQTIVGQMLRHAGYQVSAASNGQAAIDAVRSTAFDVVLMDWQMPGMDGLEAARRLRAGAAGAAGKQVPIIALTANAFAEDRDACLAAGMNDYLTKPILSGKLMAAIARWTTESAPLKQPIRPGDRDAAASAIAADPVFDPGVLAAFPMVADGTQPELVGELLQLFVDSTLAALPMIRNAVASGDAKLLHRAVHSLKSSSASVGALALSRIAALAEDGLRAGLPPPADLVEQLQDGFDLLRAHIAQSGNIDVSKRTRP